MKEMDDLTLREKEILFEMESQLQEDLLPPEDEEEDILPAEDEEDTDLWDDEEEAPSIPRKPKASWPEVKAQLNHWGQVFSSGDDSQRAMAAEWIFRLFEEVTESAKDIDPKKLDQWYSNAMGNLRIRFIGEIENPIRFLKHYYPEDLFYNAVLHTLGFSEDMDDPGADCEDDALEDTDDFLAEEIHENLADDFTQTIKSATAGYDASKGASYVTYFVKTLDILCKRRRRALSKDHKQDAQRFFKSAIDAEVQEEDSAPEALAISADRQRLQVRALTDLAGLTADALLLKKRLPIGDEQKGDKSISASTLQLYYSFQLVNCSRHATSPVSHREDCILIGAADEDFLIFSTEILDFTYWGLVQAELSRYILENNLCKENYGKMELMQRAVADYCNTTEGSLSVLFKNVLRYLKSNWDFQQYL